MQYEYFFTNDKVKLAYQTSIPLQPSDTYNPNDPQTSTPPSQHQQQQQPPPPPPSEPKTCIILLHGFSGSSEYFTRNTPTLAQNHWLISPDLRGHGKSSRPTHGHHVARLASDLHDLINHIHTHRPSTQSLYAIGCSIGAAVLWTYTELFTDRAFSGLIFVDQAPLQNRSSFGGGWGPEVAHYGCYDEDTMVKAQIAWSSENAGVKEETYRGLVDACLGYRYSPEEGDGVSDVQRQQDEEFFVGVSRSCDGVWLARLLADHTGYDHRESIELIEKPVLVLIGKRSGCFSVPGMMETVRRVMIGGKGVAKGVVFDSGHWLFWEEPEKFNRQVLDFVEVVEGKMRLEGGGR